MAKQKTETTAVAKRENAELEKLPDWVLEDDAGREGGTSEDLVLPRLGICQAMSEERKKGNTKYINGLEEGDFFNTVTREIYSRPLLVTPLMVRHSRILWEDAAKMGSGVKCFGRPAQNVDGGIACQLNNGGPCLHPGFEKESCKLFMNFPVLLHSDPNMLIVVSLKSAGIIIGKQWYTLLKLWRHMGRAVPWYAQQFALDTAAKKFAQGEAFMLTVTRVPGFPPAELGKQARGAFDQLSAAEKSGQTIRPHDEDATSREAGDEM